MTQMEKAKDVVHKIAEAVKDLPIKTTLAKLVEAADGSRTRDNTITEDAWNLLDGVLGDASALLGSIEAWKRHVEEV